MLDALTVESDQTGSARRFGRRPEPEALFEAYFISIHRYFARRTACAEDAQDLAAETFAAVVGAKLPRNVEPLSWLYGIARRKLADHLRRQRRQPNPARPVPPSDARGEELRKLIDALPNDQREALLLQALEELSIQQIAQVMKRSPGSVKALIQRAKEKIRAEYRIGLEKEQYL